MTPKLRQGTREPIQLGMNMLMHRGASVEVIAVQCLPSELKFTSSTFRI
jgi:hypothetical protein